MKRKVVSFRSNARIACQLWGEPSGMALRSLRELTVKYSLSVATGDLLFLDGPMVCNPLRPSATRFPERLPWNYDNPSRTRV
jgi:hypothetical protein